MELFEPILRFFAQRWVHNIIWAVILAIGTAVAAKVVSKTLNHLLNRDDNPLPASSIFINIARAVIWMIGGSFILDNCFGIKGANFILLRFISQKYHSCFQTFRLGKS